MNTERRPQAMSVLIVEDHEIMRTALSDQIGAIDGFEVGIVAASGEEALAALADTHVDAALIDLSLPQMSGDELVTAIRRDRPDLPCAILSGHQEPRYVRNALRAGANGYLVKGYPEEVEPALRSIVTGNRYLSRILHGLGDTADRAR